MNCLYKNFVLPKFLDSNYFDENPFINFDIGASIKAIAELENPVCAIYLNSCICPSLPNNCKHSFCFRCLKLWAKSKRICPLCRRSFTKIIRC